MSNQLYYDAARKWFALVPLVAPPVTTLLIDAPFGRFSPKTASAFVIDGLKSWICMELVLPATLITTYYSAPLSPSNEALPPLTSPNTFLLLLVLIHYLNRAILSPLRTPSRSKTHIIVPFAGGLFNVVNGSLLGSYLSSPVAVSQLQNAYSSYRFWFGVTMWAVGLAGNIIHDEILLNIRRRAKSKGKGKVASSNGHANGTANNQEHYAIPQGLLYEYISYPNYFCEWTEWLGFAIASGPFPVITRGLFPSALNLSAFTAYLTASPTNFFPTLTPPYLFFAAEVVTMLPRAYRGHLWYKQKFDEYPKERKIVIPWIL